MSAGRLRASAALLRRRATLAAPGAWQVRIACSGMAVQAIEAEGEAEVTPIIGHCNAEYIASMHPGVALALATLLEAAADYTVPDPHDPACDCCPCCEKDRNALAVADAILGRQS